jgi:hypothetical protein
MEDVQPTVEGPFVIEPSHDEDCVKEGDHILFYANDGRWWFGVAKKKGYRINIFMQN